MWKRLKQCALAVVAGATVLTLLSSSPANATGLAAPRTVFYAGVVAGEYLPWVSDNQVTGRSDVPMEGLWIMPWGGGEICATASIPGRGWQNWQCAPPGVSFMVGTFNQGLTMNGLSVRTQFGKICLQVATMDPSRPRFRSWWGPYCSTSGIGIPAGNQLIELVAIYYES